MSFLVEGVLMVMLASSIDVEHPLERDREGSFNCGTGARSNIAFVKRLKGGWVRYLHEVSGIYVVMVIVTITVLFGVCPH